MPNYAKTPFGGDGSTTKKVKYKAGTRFVAEDAHLKSAPFEVGTKFFYNDASTPTVISQIKGNTVSVVSDDKTAIAKEFVKELQVEGEEASQTYMVFDFGETLSAVTGNVLAGRRFQAVERNINVTEEGITLTDTESAESSNYSRAILSRSSARTTTSA